MKHKLLRYSSIVAALVFVAVFFGLAIKSTPDTTAVKATDFKAGRIIDDGVFYNANTMTVAQIQSFMDKTLPTCDMWGTGKLGYGYYINGKAVDPNTTRKEYARRMREEVGDKRYHAPPYVCINKYYENPKTHVSNFDTNGAVKDGMISAAQIIHDAAKEYSINPQVLLVMLKKESYAWGDNWPTKNEYNTVMGYACPDNAACNTKYYGFYNQVNMAAWQLDYYKKHIYSYNYRPYATNKIYYSPTYSCGSKNVYIENYATASLYIYTPYTPNDAALKNYPGTASCGSYGNRNFFMYFSEWFGSTLFNAKTTAVSDGDYYIYSAKNTNNYIYTNKATTNYSYSFEKRVDDADRAIYKIQKNEDGSYTILNTSLNAALDIVGSAEEGAVVKPAIYNPDSETQKWVIYDSDNKSYSFAPVKNKTVALTFNETTNSFTLASYTKADWQKYLLESYSPKTTAEIPNKDTTPEQKPVETTGPQAGDSTKEYTAAVENGTYSIISSINNMAAITLLNTNTSNYTPLQVTANGNKNTQRFEIQFDKTTGYYTIRSTLVNKYLWASVNDSSNGVVIKTMAKIDDCSEKWTITKNSDGTFTIGSACTDKLAVTVGVGQYTSGVRAQLRTKNNSKAQKFTFVRYYDASLNGQYYIKSAVNTGYDVDVYNGIFANGKNIQLYKSDKTKAQRFTLKYISSCGCYTVQSYNSNYVLDVKGGTNKNGTNVQIYKSNNTNAQKWYIAKEMSGYYTFRNVGTNKLLNLSSTSIKNGLNINIWQDKNTNTQKWKFEKIK